MEFWKSYFCFGLLVLVFGKNASSVPVSQKPEVPAEMDKKENRKNSDTAMQCVLELIELMTSDYSELSQDCERIMNRLVDETSNYDVVNKKSDDDADALKTLIEPKTLEKPEKEVPVEEEKRSRNSAIKALEMMKNPRMKAPSAPANLKAAKNVDETLQPNLVGDSFEEEIKFGKPFMTSFNGVDDKFLIVPMRMSESEDEYVPIEDAKISPDLYDDLYSLEPEDLKDDDYLSDLEKLSPPKGKDYDVSRDPNLDDLARIWGNLNPKSEPKDADEDEKIKDGMLFDLEMDLEKLNEDLKSLKKP